MLLPNNQRQHRTVRIHKDVLPTALRYLICPVSATRASISRMDSISTSYPFQHSGVLSGGRDVGEQEGKCLLVLHYSQA